ncbi:MAG: bifunctional phosphopantothenoylcysteine decarboxylase/phosphopantothenate--cysteine ligase CoaBC [Gemmatimonadota bacterium]
MRPFDGRSVLLIVTGGIAAYKSAYLARRLVEAGAEVDVVLTAGAQRFIGAVTFEGLTGRPAHRSLWQRPMAHLDLGKDADLAIVAPATASFLSRLAAGAADDLATAILLAAPCPIAVCPAMNQRMWDNPLTVRNLARLRERGIRRIGPAIGALAEGESGPGRMAEPDEIMVVAGRLLEKPSPLTGRRIVVTAGPTRAAVDPIRYLGNRSSGRMGFALAASAWRRGGDVTVIAGPGAAARPYGPEVVEVTSTREMGAALRSALPGAALLAMAAAVADFEPREVAEQKLKKETREEWILTLKRAPDLLLDTAELRRREGILSLGFALETEAALENGRRKLEEKQLDFVAINEAGAADAGFESPTNRVTLVDRWGEVEEIPLLPKEEIADRLLDRVEERLPSER